MQHDISHSDLVQLARLLNQICDGGLWEEFRSAVWSRVSLARQEITNRRYTIGLRRYDTIDLLRCLLDASRDEADRAAFEADGPSIKQVVGDCAAEYARRASTRRAIGRKRA